MQAFVNANASFSFTVEKQATDSINPTAGFGCAHVRAGGGWGPPCGNMRSLPVFGDYSLQHPV